MRTSVIRQRVADFLKRHAPFDALSGEDLLELAASGKVSFHECEEFVFREGQAKTEFLWVIQQGRVEILKGEPPAEILRDVCGEGDILGIEFLAAGGPSPFSARTATDVILYGISSDLVEAAMARYPAIESFFAAQRSLSGVYGLNRKSWLDAPPPPVSYLIARTRTVPVSVSRADAERAVAASPAGVVALLDENAHPIGAISAEDLCAMPDGTPLAAARPAPPALSFPYTTRAAVEALLGAQSDVLAITQANGTGAPALGLLTSSDLAMFCGHNPVRIADSIRHASSVDEIKPLLPLAAGMVRSALAEPRDTGDCCLINSRILWALTSASIRLADAALREAGFDAPGVPFCWVVFGGAARGDLMRLEFPTIAAVYDDTALDCGPSDSMYFAALVGETAEWFHAFGLSGPGFYWPENARPSMPLSEWKRFFQDNLRDPVRSNLYAQRAFFDINPVFGDEALFHRVKAHIESLLEKHPEAVGILAKETLAHTPPLTFLKGQVLQPDGSWQECLDIDKAILTPVAQAARVFMLSQHRVSPASTLARLEAAAQAIPSDAAAIRHAAEAFRLGLFYQEVAGGAVVRPNDLEKFDQLLLKNAFESVRAFLDVVAGVFRGDL